MNKRTEEFKERNSDFAIKEKYVLLFFCLKNKKSVGKAQFFCRNPCQA